MARPKKAPAPAPSEEAVKAFFDDAATRAEDPDEALVRSAVRADQITHASVVYEYLRDLERHLAGRCPAPERPAEVDLYHESGVRGVFAMIEEGHPLALDCLNAVKRDLLTQIARLHV